MTSLEDTKRAIDAAAKASGFRCVPVSWEDAQRAVYNGNPFGPNLSTGGPNIADVRLYEKTGRLLYTLRSENWNERLGYVSSEDVTLVTGNETGSAVQSSVSLAAYLQSVGRYGSYVGVQQGALYAPGVDEIFSIRFQAVFLPVAEPSTLARAFGMTTSERATTEFCTEVYSYNTRSDDDPRNMLLLATPQGTSMQQDSARAQRLYYHSVDGSGAVQRYWLEAEQSDHRVGGQQTETLEEAMEAAQRGKAVAVRIGPSALGTRFNVQMLIQVPLKQRVRPAFHAMNGGRGGRGGGGFSAFGGNPFVSGGRGGGAGYAPPAVQYECFSAAVEQEESCFDSVQSAPAAAKPAASFGAAQRQRLSHSHTSAPIGKSNAARVSRGSLQDTYAGVANKTPEREPSMHGTITVTLYYTVVGGVPSVEDVHRCVADLDALYKAMPSDKRLVHCTEVTKSIPTIGKPFGTPLPPPPVPPSLVSLVRCASGHPLSKHTPSSAPPNGYNCDACGTYYAVGEQLGFGCRTCDYDLCVKCHDMGPKCSHNAALVPVPVPSLQATPYRQCTGCSKHIASHVGSMYGCHCAAAKPGFGVPAAPKILLCMHCYLQKVVAAKMSS